MAIDQGTQINVSKRGPLHERVASSAITPGMVLQVDPSDGTFIPAIVLATEYAFPIFAIEDIRQSKTIDDDYAIGDTVFARWMRGGDTALGWVVATDTVTTGDYLQADGGRLAVVADPQFAVALALEDVTTAGTPARIQVAVLR